MRNAHRQTWITLATSQFQCPPEDMDIAHTPHTSPECFLFQAAPVCPPSPLPTKMTFGIQLSLFSEEEGVCYDLPANCTCCSYAHFCYFRTCLFKIARTCLVLSSTATPAIVVLAILNVGANRPAKQATRCWPLLLVSVDRLFLPLASCLKKFLYFYCLY